MSAGRAEHGIWRVPAGELRWALAISLLALLVVTLPYVVCAAGQTADHRFGWVLYDAADIYTYLAEMRQGADGAWLLHLPFTSEDHPRALVHPFYLLLGKAGRLLGLDTLLTYHAARLLAGLILLLSAYNFFAYFTPYRAVRRLALLLTAFTAGLGWLVLIVAGQQWLGDFPVDFLIPEAFTLATLYRVPHIALTVTLMLLAALCYLEACVTARWGWAVAAGLAGVGIILLVPYAITIVWGAMGFYLITLGVRRRTLPLIELRAALTAALVAAPALAYNLWVFNVIPAFREWARQNVGLSPHPLHFMMSLSVPLALALAGLWSAARRGKDNWLLPAGWLLATAVALYLPFNLQRRMILGLHPVLSLWAAAGIAQVVLPALSRRWRRPALGAIFVLLLPSNLFLLIGPLAQMPAHPEPLYQSREKLEAVAWLATHTPAGSIILSSIEAGNFIPTRSSNWVYLGHGDVTLDSERKLSEVHMFYSGQMPAAEMADFLRRNRIAWVYQGVNERALGTLQPERYTFLEPAYSNAAVRIYRVQL
jgi:hypothetical protein